MTMDGLIAALGRFGIEVRFVPGLLRPVWRPAIGLLKLGSEMDAPCVLGHLRECLAVRRADPDLIE